MNPIEMSAVVVHNPLYGKSQWKREAWGLRHADLRALEVHDGALSQPEGDELRAYYGAAGIVVCERWHDFPAFRTDMGECPDRSMTVDRLDNAKDYEPGNCRWATKAQQNRNRPSHRVELTLNGETHSVTEWAAKRGMKVNVINQRLYLGWTAEKALTTPVQGTGRFGDR